MRLLLVVALLLVVPMSSNLARVASAAPALQAMEVEVDDNYFEPKNLTVAVGATVTWKNEGQRAHTVTADDHSFDSGDLAHDGVFTWTFAKAGTYPYYCEHHGEEGGKGMAGTITVTAAGGAPAPTTMPATGAPVGPATGAMAILALVISILGLGVRQRAHRSTWR
jgi:plastocyanin